MEERKTVRIALSDIKLNNSGINNCRRDVGDVRDLKSSIKSKGLLTQLILWKSPGTEDYTLIAGYRRHKALSQLVAEGNSQFDELECLLFEGDLSEALALNLEENIQRVNLNAADEAEAVERLYSALNDQKKLAEMLNMSVPWVSMRVTLVRRTVPEVITALREGKINFMQARTLAKNYWTDGVLDAEGQLRALEALIEVPEVEDKPKKKRDAVKTKRTEKEITELEKSLLETNEEITLGTPHRLSVLQTIRWFRCQVEKEDMLFAKETELREVGDTTPLDDFNYDDVIGNLEAMRG